MLRKIFRPKDDAPSSPVVAPPERSTPAGAPPDETSIAAREPASAARSGILAPRSFRDDLTSGRHTVAYLRHLARGNDLRRAELANVDGGQPPVVLIHGFLGTRGSMYPLERRLVRDGVSVFSFNLGLLNTGDITASARVIEKKIDALLSQLRLPHVDIVAHSMGGLIGLYYVKRLGGADKVRKLVMMGTPSKGTWSAAIGIATVGLFSRSSWQIFPASRFLRDLFDGEPLPDTVRYYTICAERDWLCPPSRTELPQARRVTVPLGHSSLVVSGEVYRHVIAALRE